jgi:predicted ATP-dependent endonuclease of OLD family
LRDSLHDITINFNRRSSGFKWFFSFLVAFSEFEFEERPIIILLDEPGLNLHAKAQNDFLKFIKERLADKHQVIYTTHSPFMIEPKNLHQVRLVEDFSERTNKIGSKITSKIFSTNFDTIFPLQSALGYDLAQNLFVGKHNLVVEGTSDFVYLNLISRHLEESGRNHLDFSKLTITPVGGASKVATFVALMGQHLDATVFIDADHKQNQQISELINKGLIKSSKYLTPADFLNKAEADIEDLFKLEDYLSLYNEAFSDNLKESDLNGNDQIIKRIARARSTFDHGKPADLMLRDSTKKLADLSEETFTKFEEVFKKINETIEL